MCWLQKHNSGPILVETVDQFWSRSHTEVQSWDTRRQRLIHTPCSTLPRLRLSAEAAEDNLARHTARALYPQQGCGHVEPQHTITSKLDAQQTNRPVHLSARQDIWRHSIPLMASRLSNKPLLGIQTVESAITWHPDMSNQQSVPHVNVYERSTGSRHSSCTSFSVSTPAMNLKVS